MTRPLLVIFLTIFVNLIGFGIIIPLLPFYAETFGASPLVIGLLFAVFSICQLVAAPVLGDLSDRYGRRPVLIFSLLGTVVSFVMLAVAHTVTMLFLARIVDGLSGGNISTARAYVADVTEPKDRARAYGLIGAAFGLGFIVGPALSGVSPRSATPRQSGRPRRSRWPRLRWPGSGCRKPSIALRPAPDSRFARCRRCCRPQLGRVLVIDFCMVCVRHVPDDVRAVHGAAVCFRCLADRILFRRVRRARRPRARRHDSPIVKRLGDQPTFIAGLVCHRRPVGGRVDAFRGHFAAALVPLAFGMGFGHPTMSSLVSKSARGDEQGRVQGAASAVESLGRTVGPVWGNASLQRFGEGMPFLSAAVFLLLTFAIAFGYRVSDPEV
jgi:DHA1 family tetracycline resistance protein-like MFS transporter